MYWHYLHSELRVGLHSSFKHANQLASFRLLSSARPSRSGFSKTIGIFTKVKIKTWNSPANFFSQFCVSSNRESESRATAATTPTGLREDWLYVFCLERSLAGYQTYRFIMANWRRCVNDRVPSFLVTSQWIVKLPLKKIKQKRKLLYNHCIQQLEFDLNSSSFKTSCLSSHFIFHFPLF